MLSVRKRYGGSSDKSITNGIKTIQKNPKFKRAIMFTLNQLHKSTVEAGTQCRENGFYFIVDEGYVTLNKVLEIHFKDDEVVIVTGYVLLGPLKELQYNEVKLLYINAGQPGTCLQFLGRKDSSQEARDIMLDI